jgi:IS66 Orf2 like protein
MRKQRTGLAALVQEVIKVDPFCGSLFVFTGRRNDRIKILWKAGYCYLSWNARAARLLLPDLLSSAVHEMKGARYVIVSRGPWRDQGGRDSLELLFEDESSSPYTVHLTMEQTDRSLPADNQGGGFVVTVWTRSGEQLRFPGKYRTVVSIPCLEAWNEQ